MMLKKIKDRTKIKRAKLLLFKDVKKITLNEHDLINGDDDVIEMMSNAIRIGNQQGKEFQAICLKSIYSSKTNNTLATSAANGITILNRAEFNFSHYDFSDIQIPGADLRNSVCFGTNFQRANLQGVRWGGAFLMNAQCQNSQLADVEFEEKAFLEAPLEIKAFAMHSTSTDLIWWAACQDNFLKSEREAVVYQWIDSTGECKEVCHLGKMTYSVIIIDSTCRWLAVGSKEGELRLWELSSGQQRYVLNAHTAEITALIFLMEKPWLVSASKDKNIKIWNWKTGEIIRVLSGHESEIRSLALSSNNQWLASGAQDEAIRLWSLEKGELKTLFRGHDGIVFALIFDPQGRWLISGSKNRIYFWCLRTSQLGPQLVGHSSSVISFAFNSQGTWLASGSYDRTVRLWCMETLESKYVFTGHTGWVNFIAFHPHGQWLISVGACNDQAIRFWRLSTNEKSPAFVTGHEKHINFMMADCQKHWLVSTSGQIIYVWQLSNGKPVTTFLGHRSSINALAIDVSGKWLASASNDETVIIRNLQNGRDETVLKHHGAARKVLFHPQDSNYLVTTSINNNKNVRYSQSIYIWHRGHESPQIVINSVPGVIYSLIIEPLGQWLISAASQDGGVIRLWSINTGAAGPILKGDIGDINCLAMDSQGNFLAASGHHSIKLWDIKHSELEVELKGHFALVNNLSFDPQGKWLASSSQDKTIRLWHLPYGQPGQIISWPIQVNQIILYRDIKNALCLVLNTTNAHLICLDINTENNPSVLWLQGKSRTLEMEGLDISQAVGLSKQNQNLCYQRGACDRTLFDIEAEQLGLKDNNKFMEEFVPARSKILREPYNAASFQKLGDLLFNYECFEPAIYYYKMALKVAPLHRLTYLGKPVAISYSGTHKVYRNLAYCYHIIKNLEQANAIFKQGIDFSCAAELTAEYAHFLWQIHQKKESLYWAERSLSEDKSKKENEIPLRPEIQQKYNVMKWGELEFDHIKATVCEPLLKNLIEKRGHFNLSTSVLSYYLIFLYHREIECNLENKSKALGDLKNYIDQWSTSFHNELLAACYQLENNVNLANKYQEHAEQIRKIEPKEQPRTRDEIEKKPNMISVFDQWTQGFTLKISNTPNPTPRLSLDDELNTYEKLTKSEPNNSFAWHNLASYQFAKNNIQKANECFKKALEFGRSQSTLCEYANFLLVAKVYSDPLSSPLKMLYEVINSAPDSSGLVFSLLEQSNLSGTRLVTEIKHYRTFTLSPHTLAVWLLVNYFPKEIKIKADKLYSISIELSQKFITSSPKHEIEWVLIGLIFIKLNSPKEALDCLTKVTKPSFLTTLVIQNLVHCEHRSSNLNTNYREEAEIHLTSLTDNVISNTRDTTSNLTDIIQVCRNNGSPLHQGLITSPAKQSASLESIEESSFASFKNLSIGSK